MAFRLLHALDSVRPEAGSVVLLLPGLIRALAARGIESSLLSIDRDANGANRLGLQAASLDELERMMSACDAVHVHGVLRVRARLLLKTAVQLDKPVIWSPLGGFVLEAMQRLRWDKRLSTRWQAKRVLHQCAGVTALNCLEADQLQSGFGLSKVRNFSYGFDFANVDSASAAREAAATVDQTQHVLVLGPVDPAEGLVPLLQALASWPDMPRWHVTLAGPERSDWRQQLESAVRRKGGQKHVTFVTDPDPARIDALLGQSSALVVPSLGVRCPTSILQAVARGVPVIASDRVIPDPLREAVIHCRPDRQGILGALQRFAAQSPEDRTRAATRALEIARRSLDWSQTAAEYAEWIQSACAARVSATAPA